VRKIDWELIAEEFTSAAITGAGVAFGVVNFLGISMVAWNLMQALWGWMRS
jgi:uncharacterized membrane protein YjfL (UPF0719 family)